MRFGTMRYPVQQGFRNIVKNKMFSIASIATMAACIFLFGVFYSIIINFQYIVEKAEERTDKFEITFTGSSVESITQIMAERMIFGNTSVPMTSGFDMKI